jgi:hypothetical protein
MGARLVLLAFILLDVLVGVALSPVRTWIAPVNDWVLAGLTLGTFALLLALDYPARFVADRFDFPAQNVVIGILVVVGLLLATFALMRLLRKDGRGKAGATFLLLLAVEVPAGVVLTLYEFSTFGH